MEENLELSITRLVDAPRERIYEAWTDPELLRQWFVPKPWGVATLELDVRPGGVFSTTMLSPEGQEFPNVGVFLEVLPNERIVTTDAFGPGWVPKADPFMVAVITLEDENGKTRYTARARHWTAEAKARHEAMGFHEGWNKALDQLVELVSR